MCSNYNIDSRKFINDVNKFYDSQINLFQQKYDKKLSTYKAKNWVQSDNDEPFKTYLQRIQLCQQNKLSFNQQVEQNCKHGDGLFTLANVINNEAGTCSQKAKLAIAYAYLNRTSGIVREPKGTTEISHYKQLNIRFSRMTTLEKYSFLPNFVESMNAAETRLSDSNPTNNDPTSAATHWVSPSGLRKTRKHGYYYRKQYGRYFPLWARANNDPMVSRYIRQQAFETHYKEFPVDGVDHNQFLFYVGVK